MLRTVRDKNKLIQAEDVCMSAVHPDTQKPLPWIMRVSSFMPMNIPLVMAFLLAPPTMMNTIAVNVANQAYNATMNFGNANSQSPYTTEDITKGAIGAICSSVVVALTIR